MEEEAENLRKRFAGLNRAKFARDFGIKGGQASVYNHISALRPINLDAARRYAKGFGCKLEEISPRLAAEVAAAAPYAIAEAPQDDGAPTSSPTRNEPARLFRSISEHKINALSDEDLIRLETAILLSAAQLGIDIKK